MEIKEAIWDRRSIRRYKDKNINDDILKKIIEAGSMAPSACNQQRYSFIVINDVKVKARLIDEANAWQIGRAPVAIYVITDKTYNYRRSANIVGTAMSVQNMLLYAHSIGIASIVMAGYGIEPEVRKILSIPKSQEVICALSFGYADENPFKPLKRNINRIINYNFFSQNNNQKDPSNWEWDDILEFWDTSISAKSPDIGYYSFFKDEFISTIKLLNKFLCKRNLILFDDFALYTIDLAKENPEANFDCLVSSKVLRDWCRERAAFCEITNVKFYDNVLEIGNQYEIVLLIDTLNRVPTKRFQKISNIANEKLNNKGKFILGFINYLSIYGLFIRNGKGRRFGPEISIKKSKVKKLLKNSSFSISDSYGINLIPSLGPLRHLGVPKKLEFIMPFIKLWSKINFFEKITSKYIFKFLCNKYIYILNKKS